MKKRIEILLTVMLITSPLFAQNETLTNSSIIKMVQAKLTDELIISVVNDSDVNFDLGNTGITELRKANVSDSVIEAMKNAMGSNVTATSQQVSGAGAKLRTDPGSVEALGYVGPVTGLITFYEEDFKSMVSTFAEWNTMISGSLNEINSLNAEIADIENQLAELKNANAAGYSEEIINLKKSLAQAREKFEELKEKMLADGEDITGKLTAISSEKVKSVNKQYSSVSQKIKSAGADPAKPGSPVKIDLTDLEIPEGLTTYLRPADEIFYWYLNEIEDIGKIIAEWNIKVENSLAEYEALKAKLEPVEQQLAEYEKNSKQYRDEISDLKDQQSAIEKEIKALEKRMENDNGELSAFIKESGANIQKIITERITDIIAGINFLYHQKLNV